MRKKIECDRALSCAGDQALFYAKLTVMVHMHATILIYSSTLFLPWGLELSGRYWCIQRLQFVKTESD